MCNDERETGAVVQPPGKPLSAHLSAINRLSRLEELIGGVFGGFRGGEARSPRVDPARELPPRVGLTFARILLPQLPFGHRNDSNFSFAPPWEPVQPLVRRLRYVWGGPRLPPAIPFGRPWPSRRKSSRMPRVSLLLVPVPARRISNQENPRRPTDTMVRSWGRRSACSADRQ
jgi:hypothetical protein